MKMTKFATLEEYYSWLCDLVYPDNPAYKYTNLINVLYEKPFTWSIPNDDNRMFEGRNLREQFCKEADIEYVYEHFNEEVSVLEVLIALAYRCESIMVDQDRNFPMRDWFWKMMENVGLIDYTDDEWSPFTVMEKVNIIIKRQYERNGKGGLFPLKRTKEDQRKVELWYQMNYYLVENYYNED